MASPRRRIWCLIFVLIANFLLMGGPQAGKVYACSCAETRDVEESFEKSAAIFSGRVVKAEGAAPVPPDGDDPFLGPVTFEVEEAWKGASEGSVVVYGQGPEPSCGIDFERGERTSCTPTAPTATWERTIVGARSHCRLRGPTSAS